MYVSPIDILAERLLSAGQECNLPYLLFWLILCSNFNEISYHVIFYKMLNFLVFISVWMFFENPYHIGSPKSIYQPNKMSRIFYLRPDLLVPSYFLAKVFLYITIRKKCFEMPDIFTVYGNVLILLNDQKKCNAAIIESQKSFCCKIS